MTATHPGPGQPFGSLLSGGDYQTRPSNFLASFLFHALLVVALLQFANWIVPRGGHPGPARSPSAAASIIFSGTGGGGGGTHDPFPASRGVLPRLSPEEQLTPPSAVSLNDNPMLPMPPTLLMAADAAPPETGQLGDPLHGVDGPASNGRGAGGESGMAAAEGWETATDAALVTGQTACIRREETE